MEQPQPTPSEARDNAKGCVIRITGFLILFAAIVFTLGAIALDLIGETASGELLNVAKQRPGHSSWTGRVDFTAKTGEHISFYPLTLPTFFTIDHYSRNETLMGESVYEVRYLASYPQLAKVKLAFFLEYVNHVFGLCLGWFILMIGSALTSKKKSKPLVIDLSRWR